MSSDLALSLREKIKNILRFFKKQIIFIIQSLPISSKYFGSPKGSHVSSKEYQNICQTSNLNNVSYIPYLPSYTYTRTPPKSIYEQHHWKFDGMYIHTDPETFVMSAPNCRVVGDIGTIITDDDKLLADVSQHFSGGEHFVFSYLKLPKCIQIDKTIAVLATAGGGSYFHWLTEVLPRVEILRKALPTKLENIDRFIVNPADKLPIITESLSLLGISSDKLIFADIDSHIQSEMFVIPSLAGYTGNPPAWVCEFLRESFLKYKSEIAPISKLYISRAKASYRKITNEDEVLECLLIAGFTPIYLEEYNFITQIALLSNAEIIVAPHGAGLTNLIWCNTGTKVLEIFSPNYVNVCFWTIADRLGLEYFYMIGSSASPIDPFSQMYQDDMSVPIKELSLSLTMMLD
jgi:Glycosyltransferase 61